MFRIRLRHTFDKSHRIDQKGADDRRVQAFVIQNQHRVVQTRTRVHHIAAGAGMGGDFPEIWRNVTGTVHARKIEMTKCRNRATVPVDRQTVDR